MTLQPPKRDIRRSTGTTTTAMSAPTLKPKQSLYEHVESRYKQSRPKPPPNNNKLLMVGPEQADTFANAQEVAIAVAAERYEMHHQSSNISNEDEEEGECNEGAVVVEFMKHFGWDSNTLVFNEHVSGWGDYDAEDELFTQFACGTSYQYLQCKDDGAIASEDAAISNYCMVTEEDSCYDKKPDGTDGQTVRSVQNVKPSPMKRHRERLASRSRPATSSTKANQPETTSERTLHTTDAQGEALKIGNADISCCQPIEEVESLEGSKGRDSSSVEIPDRLIAASPSPSIVPSSILFDNPMSIQSLQQGFPFIDGSGRVRSASHATAATPLESLMLSHSRQPSNVSHSTLVSYNTSLLLNFNSTIPDELPSIQGQPVLYETARGSGSSRCSLKKSAGSKHPSNREQEAFIRNSTANSQETLKEFEMDAVGSLSKYMSFVSLAGNQDPSMTSSLAGHYQTQPSPWVGPPRWTGKLPARSLPALALGPTRRMSTRKLAQAAPPPPPPKPKSVMMQAPNMHALWNSEVFQIEYASKNKTTSCKKQKPKTALFPKPRNNGVGLDNVMVMGRGL